MTDRDKIELPPLPEHENMMCYVSASMRDYAYTAVLADRERRAEQAKPAEPKVHQAILQLTTRGNAVMNPAINSIYACATVTLCWTDDGRAWIDSERNRELAADVRHWPTRPDDFIAKLADALDGGVR